MPPVPMKASTLTPNCFIWRWISSASLAYEDAITMFGASAFMRRISGERSVVVAL